MALCVVRLQRGGPWDWSRDMREQAARDEHARFMDGLVDTGFIERWTVLLDSLRA